MKASPETLIAVVPMAITPASCLTATGLEWRFVRDHAEELGIEVLHLGAKSYVMADALRVALARRGSAIGEREADETHDDVTELERFRARVAATGGR